MHYASCITGRRLRFGRLTALTNIRSTKGYGRWKTTFGGRQSLWEDGLPWKRTFNGRRPSMEDDLRWKTTFGGRQPAVEDEIWWKTIFVGSLHAAYSALWNFLLLYNINQS